MFHKPSSSTSVTRKKSTNKGQNQFKFSLETERDLEQQVLFNQLAMQKSTSLN